jgi:hypothetical protein
MFLPLLGTSSGTSFQNSLNTGKISYQNVSLAYVMCSLERTSDIVLRVSIKKMGC